MSEFNVLECGFNIADETVNFGSRMLADGDHLFEVCTLASIKQSDEAQKLSNINIQTLSYKNKLYYSIDKSIGIFTDLSCTGLYLNTSFEETIDEFCVTPDAKSLLICLRNGTVLYINIENQEIILNKELVRNDVIEEKFFIRCFIQDFSDDGVSFILVNKSGCIYKVVFDCAHDKNEVVILKELGFKVYTSAMIYPYLFVDGESMVIHNLESDYTIEDDALDLIKVFPYSKEMFIGLNSNGKLMRICLRTGLVFYMKHELKFKDFLYKTFPITDSESKPYCLCVTFENKIQLYDTYSVLSELKFSLDINSDIHLIPPGNIDDESIYISIIQKEDVINELRFQRISETAPEVRLKRLLRRQKFDEAETFATTYNLSNLEVLKAKAQVIVDKRIIVREDMCNLINVLDRIDDVDFKLQSCIDTYQCCENLNDVEKILLYGCNSVVKLSSSKDVTYQHDMISDIMFRFDTFKLIRKIDTRNLNWLEFHNCDVIKLLCDYLQKHNIDVAVILYNRLDIHTKLKLDQTRIEKILNLLDELPLEVYRPFLYCFIPLSLSYLPRTLPSFVKWLKRKVYFIEQYNLKEFPENVIEFTNSIIRFMKVDCGNLNFQQQNTVNREATDELANLVKALRTLQLLKNTYKIIVPLKEYLKGPGSLIQTVLSLDLDENSLDRFLQDFILENNLDSDGIFLEAIQNVLQYEEDYWSRIVPPILKNIRSIEVKLTAVNDLIVVANVPWSESVKEIARNSLEYEHELTHVIEKAIENEPLYRILNKSSYNLQDVAIDCIWDIQHAIGRIMYCNEPSMIDDIYQLCRTTEQRHVANVMLIEGFVKTRNFGKALEILDNNSPEETRSCCESVVRIVKYNDQMKLFHRNEPYLQILHCLERRSNIDNRLNEQIRNILTCWRIRSGFYDKIQINDLECPAKKLILLDTILCNLIQDFRDGNASASETINSCKKIADLLNESKEATMIKFCRLISNDFKIIEDCAAYIYNDDQDPKNLCLMGVLILKSVSPGINPDDLLNATFGLNETMPLQQPTMSVEDQIRCLRIAHKLATKAILHAGLDEIGACIEVFNWTMSTVYMVKETSAMEKSVFEDSYVPEISFPSMRSLYSIKHVVNACASFVAPHVNPDLKYFTYFEITKETLTEDQFSSKVSQLPMMIQNFCLEGQTLTAFKLILTLKNALRHTTIATTNMKTLNAMIKQCITQLLQKVIGRKKIDEELAYGLLISCEPNESIPFLNRQLTIYKKQIAKFRILAQLALQILNYHNIHMNKEFYIKIIQVSNWWMRICDCQIPVKTFFKSSQEQLLELLIHHQHVDLEMIKEFCEDFQLDVQNYYRIYLMKSLLNWKPEYDRVEDVYGKVRIEVRTNEDQLIKRCNRIIDLLENKEAVYDFINGFKHGVNFYHYEVFFAIFTILSSLNKNIDYKKQLLLLQFLRTYQRINKPSDSEIEEWYTLFPDRQSIDPLSQWRMPFTPTLFSIDIWKIIRPELNLQTYSTWFQLIPILDKILNKNEICSYVIKEIVSSGVLQKTTTSNQWSLHPVHDHLFEQVDRCVQNMSNLEMATSAVYQLVMHTPKGADQVNAAKLCLKYAIQYKESGLENDPALLKAFIKVEKKYQSFAANHILHLCRIDIQKYSDILLEPNELIDALYTDESLVERADRIVLNCADINKAIDDLGILFDINIHQTRLKLLETWLSERTSPNFNLTMSSNNLMTGEVDINSVNLKRAAYICQSENIVDWQKYLLKVGLEETATKNFYYKANALHCFIIISDDSTIEKLTMTSCDEFRNYVDKLYLLSDLEYLGLSMTVETLNNYNKTYLLRRLAQDIYNPITIKTMAALCMTYSEYDVKFWQIIITTAIKMNLVQSLKKYVHFLKNEPAFKYKKFYIGAWQNVIDQSFNFGGSGDDDRLYDRCVENMLMIQSCPVLPSLNLTTVFDKCYNIRMYEFSAIIIQYLPVEEQKSYVKRIMEPGGKITSAVSKLYNYGIWGTIQVKMLLESY